jgi:hypothetical protein
MPREGVRPEVKPDAPPPDVATPPAAPATVPPLQTAGTADTAQAQREVSDMLGRAEGLLNQVDYGRLSAVRQKAYQEAQLFIKQSEAALKESNYVFARKLAEKAETMAKELLGR